MKSRSTTKRVSTRKASGQAAASRPARKKKPAAEKTKYPDIRRDLERQVFTALGLTEEASP